MITIPDTTTRRIVQSNRSKILGNIWSSFNLELQENLGVIRVGSKMKLNTATADAANLGLAVGFASFDKLMWTVAGSRVFKTSANNLTTAFGEDISTNYVTTYDAKYSDIITFAGKLVTSGGATTLNYKAADGSGTGAWTAKASVFSTSTDPQKMCYFKKFDRLYFTDATTTIRSIDNGFSTTATSGDYYISLGTSLGKIATITASSERIWIGMFRPINQNADSSIEKGAILEWDGISSQVTRVYYIHAQGALAITIINDAPYVMDSNGVLLGYNGSGFAEIGRLPLNKETLDQNVTTFNTRFIHPNGLIGTKNGTILALVNNTLGDNASSVNENLPAGIWEWSKDNGFVHKSSLSYQPMATTTITDNGQQRLFSDTSTMGVGALANTNLYSTSASGKSTLICGANYYTNATSNTFGIFIDAPIPTDNATTTEGQKYGYFVTTWIMSSQVKDTWQKVFAKYRQLLNSTDKIIMKYRTTEVAPTYISITWINTTSFTTTTDVSALTGYEVEILQGTGSGKCAHITSVSGSGTYTVNLDETFTGVTTGTAKARVQAWVKIGSVSDQITEVKEFAIGKSSVRIQLKCCMEFKGDNELFELALINKTQQIAI